MKSKLALSALLVCSLSRAAVFGDFTIQTVDTDNIHFLTKFITTYKDGTPQFIMHNGDPLSPAPMVRKLGPSFSCGAVYCDAVASAATSVPYSGVTGLPTTCTGFASDCVTTGILASALGPYAQTSALSSYVTASSLSSTLAGYATSTSMAAALTPYATTASLSGYVQTSALSSYVTSSALATALGPYATSTSVASSLSGYAQTSVLSSYATTASVTSALAAKVVGKAYVGTTVKADAYRAYQSATVASGVAVFQLTVDGTASGAALFPNEVFADSVSVIVNDPSASYQMGWTFSNSNKTLTVTANKFTTANILSGILGQASANGSVVRLVVEGR